jgi:5-oxoprolinase (ATP-hydrolysing) subunit B
MERMKPNNGATEAGSAAGRPSSPARLRTPRTHAAGTGALLVDVSEGPFDLDTQKHLWSLARQGGALEQLDGVRNVVLGVNNVLVMFDPLRVHPRELAQALQQAWADSTPSEEAGRLFEVPVAYDLSPSSELEGIARNAGVSTAEVIRLHTSVEYRVACIGSVPGFVYLVGLPPQLATPRHATPRARVPKGSVIIGGSQAGITPMDMPSGWHTLGSTELDMFDAARAEPCLMAPGDSVRFIDAGAGR